MKDQNLSGSGWAPAGDQGDAAAAPAPGCEGQQAVAASADALGVLLVNDQDRRTLSWLLDRVGPDEITRAVHLLAGQRKPYLSNIAKVLSVDLPKHLAVAPPGAHRERLQAAKTMLLASAASKGIARR